MIEFLERSVVEAPEKMAFIDLERSLSFKELKNSALIISEELMCIGKNRAVVVLINRSCKSVISFMGALYSGNFYVPVDVKNPLIRIEKILNDIQAPAIIVDSFSSEMLSKLNLSNNSIIINFDHLNFNKKARRVVDIVKVIDTDPAYCIYTSGSTGNPKGVLISHRNLINYIDHISHTFQLDLNTVLGNQTQFHFDVSTVDIYATIRNCGTTHIIPDSCFVFPKKLIEYFESSEINCIYWVPSIMNFVAGHDGLTSLKKKNLHKILFAGEIMPTKTLNYWKKHFPKAMFVNLYGPTEITVTCTHYLVDREFSDSDSLPIGKPSFNYDVMLLDRYDKLIQPTDEDSLGEICVRGGGLSMGYWNDLEKTNRAFVQNPLNSHYPEKIYRTGDLGKYNEFGEILYFGRKDHQIKHMGYRIELGEIERVMSSIPGVNNNCVFYDDKRKAFVSCFEATDVFVTDGFLYQSLLQLIPKYMIPSTFIKYAEIPINSTGKIDRLKLKQEYLQRKTKN